MTDAKLLKNVRYSITGKAETHSRTVLKVRDLIDVSDEPEVRGGDNEGFAPTEMALASLLACSNVISHKIAKKNDIEVVAMDFEMDAEFDRLGVMLSEEVETPFPEINITINLTTSASNEKLDILKADLPRYCPIAKVFSNSGSKVSTNWNIIRPE